jgi:membrane associated rhomboid family serine protease
MKPTAHRSLPRPSLRTVRGSAGLLAFVLAMFFVELATAAIGDDARLLALGALPDSGAIHGQYWRLLTFGFLHSDLTHFLLNMILLLLAAPAVERRAGAGWLILLFLAASVASGVGILVKHQLWPSHGVSVGASGGAFCLLAAALVLVLRFGSQSRLLRGGLIVALVAGLAYSLLPGISLVGHLIGIAIGGMVALFIPLDSRLGTARTAPAR